MWINAKDYHHPIGTNTIVVQIKTGSVDFTLEDLDCAEKYMVTRNEPNLELTQIKKIKDNFIILGQLVLEKGTSDSLRNGLWYVEDKDQDTAATA